LFFCNCFKDLVFPVLSLTTGFLRLFSGSFNNESFVVQRLKTRVAEINTFLLVETQS